MRPFIDSKHSHRFSNTKQVYFGYAVMRGELLSAHIVHTARLPAMMRRAQADNVSMR